jgi:hypothetical protein
VTSTAKQQLGKHVPAATDMYVKIEELLEAVFCIAVRAEARMVVLVKASFNLPYRPHPSVVSTHS